MLLSNPPPLEVCVVVPGSWGTRLLEDYIVRLGNEEGQTIKGGGDGVGRRTTADLLFGRGPVRELKYCAVALGSRFCSSGRAIPANQQEKGLLRESCGSWGK